MPLSINVGLNRKASADFQSTGASINITAELDATLLTRPDELQTAIAKLYAFARTALDRQAATPPAAPASRPSNGNGNGHDARSWRGNGHSGNGNGRNAAPMTDRQRKAIIGIARENGIDPFASSRQTFDCDLNELRAWQASKLIDSLKAN